MKVYLSGAIYATNSIATIGWRNRAKELLTADTIDPCRGRAVYDPKKYTTKELVSRDKLDIRNSDILLVWGNPLEDHLSIGTWMECEFAYEHNRPIVMVSTDQRVLNHPWINEYSAKIFSTIEEACDYINKFWTP